jgi:predicted metal-dependent hydrolase
MTRASDILVRRIDFAFPEGMDLIFIEDDPRLSYYFLGAWMMLPYLEPFLIRTVQAAMPRVSDAALLEDMKRFCAQEGQHFRQHAKANEVVRRIHPAGAKLAALEAEVEALFKSWSAEKPLRFNLAYAEGFESMTAAGAITQMEQGWFDHMKEPIRSLMLWHIMEEVEHRSVCFDAYKKAGAGYLYRVFVGAWAQAHYLGLCQRFADAMIEADPEIVSRYDAPAFAAKRKARLKDYARGLRPRLMAAMLPWYSPNRMRLPPQFEPARRHFSALAQSVQ